MCALKSFAFIAVCIIIETMQIKCLWSWTPLPSRFPYSLQQPQPHLISPPYSHAEWAISETWLINTTSWEKSDMTGLGLLGVWPQSLSVASVAGDLSHVFCFLFFFFGSHSVSNSCRYCSPIIANLNFANSCFLIWVKSDSAWCLQTRCLSSIILFKLFILLNLCYSNN